MIKTSDKTDGVIDVTNTAVVISGLRLFAHHGVLEQERVIGNEFVVDARLEYDASKAMMSDNVDYALNYASVVDVITECMKTPHKLLESLAGDMAKVLTVKFDVLTGGTLTITKLKPPFAAQVDGASFTLSWQRKL